MLGRYRSARACKLSFASHAFALSLDVEDDTMIRYVTVGLTVLAGAALLEVALIPGVVIGGAAVLAPVYLPKLRRRLQPAMAATARPANRAASMPVRRDAEVPLARKRFKIGQAVAKTITFRIIVTTLDFSTNYIVIGELTTAAGLSAFALVAGPLFYLGHEAAWNYFGPDGAAVELPSLASRHKDTLAAEAERRGPTISRALAKTITFRSIATVMDFAANYVVVRDLATAAGLTAFAFVVGPFVYLGHEKAWDHFSSRSEPALDLATPTEPAPAHG
jgi:uncharacterized membrane protein